MGTVAGKVLAHRQIPDGCLRCTAAVSTCRCENPDKQNTTCRKTVRPDSLVRYVRCAKCPESVHMQALFLFRMAAAGVRCPRSPVGSGPEIQDTATAVYSVGRQRQRTGPTDGKDFAGYTATLRTRSRG